MLMLLSPSKTMDEKHAPKAAFTPPMDAAATQQLVELLQQHSVEAVQKLMDVSPAIATLNVARYAQWESAQAFEALSLFKGDVYEAMDVANYTPAQRAFAGQHLRILSGLYGLISPLDGIRPYRLEMGIGLANPLGKHLYAFWGERVTQAVNQALAQSGSDELINLASQEYAKAVLPKKVQGRVVTVEFRVKKDGKLRSIGLFAKRARGMMANYVIKHALTSSQELLAFTEDGYAYAPELSTAKNTLFFVKE